MTPNVEFTMTHALYKGGVFRMVVEAIGVGSDSSFNILVSILEVNFPNEKKQTFERGQNTITVERNWFNEELTGRKIKT